MTTKVTSNSLANAGLASEYVDQNHIKIQDGNIFIKWKGKKKFVLVDREIGEFVIAMWCIGKDEYNRRKRCVENGNERWW